MRPDAVAALLASGRCHDPSVDAVVRQMRDAIMDNDLKLLQAVNARLELVARLRAYKRAQGMDFVDPAREAVDAPLPERANRGPAQRRRASTRSTATCWS